MPSDPNQPLVADPITLAWRCQHRLHCCKTWDVPLVDGELGTIQAHLTDAWPIPEVARAEGIGAMPLRDSGACVFLEGKLCGYRARFGAETQPAACRAFPHQAVTTPRRRLLGLDFTCPTALGLLIAQPQVTPTDHGVRPLPAPWRGRRGPTEAGEAWDLSGAKLTEDDFWSRHRAVLAAFLASRAGPLERVLALAHELGAAPPTCPPLADGWDGALEAALIGPLLAYGGEPLSAVQLLSPAPADVPLDDLSDVDDVDALLTRYLSHRLLVPAWLRAGAHLGRLLGGIAALAARFHAELGRGATPAQAVRRCDLVFFHRRGASQLLGRGDRGVDWRTPLVIVAGLSARGSARTSSGGLSE